MLRKWGAAQPGTLEASRHRGALWPLPIMPLKSLIMPELYSAKNVTICRDYAPYKSTYITYKPTYPKSVWELTIETTAVRPRSTNDEEDAY